MSKKFFSLIHGGKIHVAPKTKVIPAEVFSTLLDAQDVLKEVDIDATQYRKEVTEECERLKEQAQKQGFEQGYKEWADRIAELEDEIKRVREDTQAVIIPIALKAAKKIVGRELETSKDTIVDIIANGLKSVATHKRIKVHVNRKEYETVQQQREKLKRIFERLETLSIRPHDDVQPGGCIIETEAGIINAQLENQWLILENAFQRMMRKKSPEIPEEKTSDDKNDQTEDNKEE